MHFHFKKNREPNTLIAAGSHRRSGAQRSVPQRGVAQRGGFTFVEVLISVGVLALAILTLLGLFGAVFRQIEDVVRLNRAINVVKAIDAALENPDIIGGEVIKNWTITAGEFSTTNQSRASSKFDALYTLFVKNDSSDAKTNFYYYELSRKNSDQLERSDTQPNTETSVISVIHNNDNKTTISLNDKVKEKIVGHAFRVRISVAKSMLKAQKLQLGGNEDDPIPTGGIFDGSPSSKLPDKPDDYALAFLPLFVEVFPWNPNITAAAKSEDEERPIFRQNIMINR
jgi:type II secretory pathway pseudopilin PulG